MSAFYSSFLCNLKVTSRRHTTTVSVGCKFFVKFCESQYTSLVLTDNKHPSKIISVSTNIPYSSF